MSSPAIRCAVRLDLTCSSPAIDGVANGARHASRVVWCSCRNFGVISRNLGHGPTAYAAADIVTRRDSQKFRENSSLRCFAGGGRQLRNKLDQAASVADQIFRNRPSRRVPEPVWPNARPLLFCAETARYYHRLFAAT